MCIKLENSDSRQKCRMKSNSSFPQSAPPFLSQVIITSNSFLWRLPGKQICPYPPICIYVSERQSQVWGQLASGQASSAVLYVWDSLTKLPYMASKEFCGTWLILWARSVPWLRKFENPWRQQSQVSGLTYCWVGRTSDSWWRRERE